MPLLRINKESLIGARQYVRYRLSKSGPSSFGYSVTSQISSVAVPSIPRLQRENDVRPMGHSVPEAHL